MINPFKKRMRTLLTNTDTPIIMGILNCTPNSFSDGGDYFDAEKSISRIFEMIEEGADIIDIGAESSNPKALPLTAQEEIKRLLPIIRVVRKEISKPISIDTYHPETMRAMIEEGVDIINDINGFRDPNALDVIKNSNVSLVAMHMDFPPNKMHVLTEHEDLAKDLMDFFKARASTFEQEGITQDRIIFDPGFGFGKTFKNQISLLQSLDKITALPYPILVGLSRKRLVGTLINEEDPKKRLQGNVALALWCLEKGAKIFRVHDVKATKEAFMVWETLKNHSKLPRSI